MTPTNKAESMGEVEEEMGSYVAESGGTASPKSDGHHSAGWRDISTAPRDGSRFWGRVDDDAIAMFWMEEFDGFITAYRQMVMAPGYTIDGKSFKNHSAIYQYPTAWMPIPAENATLSPSEASAGTPATDEPPSPPTGRALLKDAPNG